MRLRHLLLPLLAVPLLTACVNDGATYEIDNTTYTAAQVGTRCGVPKVRGFFKWPARAFACSLEATRASSGQKPAMVFTGARHFRH